MEDFIYNIDFEIPDELAQREALFLAIKFVMSNYLRDTELQSLFIMLDSESAPSSESPELQAEKINKFIEICEKENRLKLLINQLRVLKPTVWYDHIWLLVRPRFYLPNRDDFFIARYEQQNLIMDVLLQHPQKILVIRGVNGIGKTDLALEIARLLRNSKKVDSILWLSVQSGKVEFMEKVYEWDKWLQELAVTFAWNFEVPANESIETNQKYWDKLRTSRFLLCLDGIDDLEGHKELLNFLTELNVSGECKVIITTILNLKIKGKLEIALKGFEPQETESWLHQASLSRNINVLKHINAQQIAQLHNNLAGIPLALNWYTSQLTNNTDSLTQNIDNLKNISSEMLMEKIFDASFSHLSKPAKELLLALSIFNWPARRESWYETAGMNQEEFEVYIEELRSLSLINFDTNQNRFFLSSIAKEYCVERLRSSNISGKIYAQWIKHFQLFSKQCGSVRRRYDLISQDWENLWQAIQYIIDQWESGTSDFRSSDEGRNHAHDLIVFANSLEKFCRVRGWVDEEMLLCESAAKASDALNLPEFLGQFAYRVGWLLCDKGEFRSARQWAMWASSELENLGKGSGYAERLFARIGIMETVYGLTFNHPIYRTIEEHLNKAKKVFKEEEDPEGLARIFSDWGMLAFYCKEYDKAYNCHLQALKHFQDIGDAEGEANSFVNLGDTFTELKKFNDASENYSNALKVAGQSDFISVRAEAQRGQANVLLGQVTHLSLDQRQSHLEYARTLAQEAFETFTRIFFKADAQRTQDLLIQIEFTMDDKTIEIKIGTERKENAMVTPQDQLAVEILVEGVKFLFDELGRRLQFWRERKENGEKPLTVDIVTHNEKQFLKLDDVEKEIKSIDTTQIQSSLGILRDASIILATYREDLGNPIITSDRKAFLRVEIPKLEDKLKNEGERLQKLIEKSLK